MEARRSTATSLLIALALLAESSERSGEVFTRPLGYQLGSATLADVRGGLGPAEILTTQDESGICYYAPRARVRIAFRSSASHEGMMEATRFSMTEAELGPFSACLAMQASDEARISLAVGAIRLGITRDEFVRVTGRRNVHPDGEGLRAYFKYRTSIAREPLSPTKTESPRKQYQDVHIALNADFVSNRLTSLVVQRVARQ